MPQADTAKGLRSSWRSLMVCAAAAVMAAACTTQQQARESSMDDSGNIATPASAGPAQPAYQPVAFPMPPNSKIDRDDTLVVGSSEEWFGTLALTTKLSVDDANAYYSHALPAQGWEEQSSLISNRVVLQFINRARGRACIVTIEEGDILSRTHIEIVVAPLVASANFARN